MSEVIEYNLNVRNDATLRDGPITCFRGKWDQNVSYHVGDIISLNEKLYICMKENAEFTITDWYQLGGMSISSLKSDIPTNLTENYIPISDGDSDFRMSLEDLFNLMSKVTTTQTVTFTESKRYYFSPKVLSYDLDIIGPGNGELIKITNLHDSEIEVTINDETTTVITPTAIYTSKCRDKLNLKLRFANVSLLSVGFNSHPGKVICTLHIPKFTIN